MPLYNPASSSGSPAGPTFPATGVANVYCSNFLPTSTSAQALTGLRFYMVPVYWHGGLVTSMAFTITTAAAAGKVARCGIYNIKSDGTPGTLVSEPTASVPVAADATGTSVLSVGVTLTAGWYLLAFASDGAPSVSGYNLSYSNMGTVFTGTTASTQANALLRTLGALAAFGDETAQTWGINGAGTSCPLLGIK